MRFAMLLAGLALTAGVARATEIRLGSLSLDWPAGYTLKSAQAPFELSGPQGLKVLVTVLRPGPSANASAEGRARMQATVDRMLTEQAAKAGKVVLPLAHETLPDGTALHFVGSEASGLFKSGYLLQYALLSPGGPLALLTFEGKGDAAAVHADVKGFFNSVQWEAGEGSLAERTAFTERAAALLRAQLGADAVAIAEPLTLKVGDLQANLDRVWGYCRANAAGCDGELQRYVQGVVDVRKNAIAPVTRDAVRVAIRPADYIDNLLRADPDKKRPPPLHWPVADGLVAVPFVDSPRSARLLSDGDVKALGLTPDQIFDLALANLRQSLKPTADAARPVKPGALGTLQGDYYETSRVLLRDDWAALARAQQGVLVVALPAKDVLLYGADASPAGLEALRTLAREVSRRSPGQLSDVLLRWTDGGWQAVR